MNPMELIGRILYEKANEAFKELSECQHYELKNEGNEGYGRCVNCGEEVRIY